MQQWMLIFVALSLNQKDVVIVKGIAILLYYSYCSFIFVLPSEYYIVTTLNALPL